LKLDTGYVWLVFETLFTSQYFIIDSSGYYFSYCFCVICQECQRLCISYIRLSFFGNTSVITAKYSCAIYAVVTLLLSEQFCGMSHRSQFQSVSVVPRNTVSMGRGSGRKGSRRGLPPPITLGPSMLLAPPGKCSISPQSCRAHLGHD